MEVCPNRANVSIRVPGMAKHQIIHVDYMCNECGNCKSFCPYSSAPYQDKFTLFANREDLENSENQGFAVLDAESGECLIRYLGEVFPLRLSETEGRIPEELARLMDAVRTDYRYLLL